MAYPFMKQRQLKEEKFNIVDNNGKKREIYIQFIEQQRGQSVVFVAWDEKGNAINAGKARSKTEILNSMRDLISRPQDEEQLKQRFNTNRSNTHSPDGREEPYMR